MLPRAGYGRQKIASLVGLRWKTDRYVGLQSCGHLENAIIEAHKGCMQTATLLLICLDTMYPNILRLG
jgi:hypothetical protein